MIIEEDIGYMLEVKTNKEILKIKTSMLDLHGTGG